MSTDIFWAFSLSQPFLLWFLEYRPLSVPLLSQWPLLIKLLSWFLFIFPISKCWSHLQDLVPSLSTPTVQVKSTRPMTLNVTYILMTPIWWHQTRCLHGAPDSCFSLPAQQLNLHFKLNVGNRALNSCPTPTKSAPPTTIPTLENGLFPVSPGNNLEISSLFLTSYI